MHMEKYDPSTRKSTVMFSNHDPSYIFTFISSILKTKLSIEPVFDNKKWKMKYDIISEGIISDSALVQVELLTINNRSVCIMFSRLSGSSWEF